MIQVTCKNCGIEFETNSISRPRKFCSHPCYSTSRQGVSRPEVNKKIANSLKGQKHSLERIEKIRASRTKTIDPKILEEIQGCWSFHMSDKYILEHMKNLGRKLSSRLYARIKSEFGASFKQIDYIPYQNLPYEKYIRAIDLGSKGCSFSRMLRLLQCSEKTLRRFLNKLEEIRGIKYNHRFDSKSFANRKVTWIEK